jgi:hypothetical protein
VETRDITDPSWGDGVTLLEGAGIRVAERPRHPTRVTADRIAEHLEKYADQLTPNEVVACSVAVRAFADIAEGRRA